MGNGERAGNAKEAGTDPGWELEFKVVNAIVEGLDQVGPEADVVRGWGTEMPQGGRFIAVQGGEQQDEAVETSSLALIVEGWIPVQRKNVAGMERDAAAGG
jgi:hypothetical protein